jgi:1-acyl-sn-glycerol-3-phosphate acyltransferase
MILLAIVRALIVILSMVIWMSCYSLGRIFRRHTPDRALAMRKHWLKWIGYPVLNLNVKIEGHPHTSPAIYVANHRSFADPVVICRFVDAFVIAKAEVANYPIINQGAQLTGVLYVKRESKESRNLVRDMMIDTVEKGNNILVFPEGTVGVNKLTLDFRSGTFFEAAENSIPIVPIAIDFKSEKDLWLIPNFIKLFLSQFSKWKTEVKLSIGSPLISTDGEYLKIQAKTWIDKKLIEFHEDWTEINFEKLHDKQPMYKYKDFSKN